MKRCPKCNSQYSDLTLSFCLQDGTPLVEVKQSSVDTVAFARPVTAEKILKTQDFSHLVPPQEAPQQRNYQFAPFPQPRAPKRSHKGLMIGIFSVLVFMITGALAVFGWMYISTQKPALASAKTDPHEGPYSGAPMNVSARPSEIITNDKPADTAPAATTSSISPDAIRRDIASDIDGWKRLAETCDVSGYVARYGEKIEYHESHGVPVDDIRHDVQKTCDTYSKIELKIDNIVVAVDAEGDAATAIFDKEWRYEASPKLAQGKVHMKLHFRKVTGGWKIVSEQNLKTYYSKS